MTRWCKLVALVVGCAGAAAPLARAQDAPPAPPSKWWSPASLFHRGGKQAEAPAGDLPAGPPEDPALGPQPFPGLAAPPPLPSDQTTGAPPPPPFTAPVRPPAVAPPGPDRPPNGFSDPVPPDAENGFECNPQPPCVPCRPFFFGVDYLRWWVRKQSVPTLVTTGALTDAVPGALGLPHTRTVLDDISNGGGHDGGRVMAAWDLDQQGILGVDASLFLLDRTTPSAIASGNGGAGSAVLARPFVNVNTHQQDADPINIPGVMAGSFSASTPLRLMGADANVRYLVSPGGLAGARLTLLAGVRWVDLDEKLIDSENLADVPGLGAPGNHFRLGENFTAYNRFYGAQVGAATDYCIGPVVLQLVGKVAFGRNQEVLKISGFTTVTESDGVSTTNPLAALYVGPGNVGRFSDGKYCFVPEGEFKLAYQFNEYIRLNLGYDLLYLSRVLRPGEQINTLVNVQPVGGPPVPPLEPTLLPFKQTSLWAQGFNVGLEFNF